jgi:rubrerythrin
MKNTIQNLTAAFIGESQARNRYTFYAKAAKKEGFEQIAAIFLETADQEKTHAKRLFEHIQELAGQEGFDANEIKIEAAAPIVYGDTIANIKAAIAGEHYENREMYPEFANAAEQEGLTDIAKRLRSISRAEEHHEERYKKLLKQLTAGTVFKEDKEIVWVCRECGYTHTGIEPPVKCPSCDHPRAYYQRQCEEY